MIQIVVKTAFDEKRITVPAEAGMVAVFRRLSAFIMTTARQSVKRAPKIDKKTGRALGRGRRKPGVEVVDATAPEGQPPYKHGSSTWTNMIQFAVDKGPPLTAVIGIMKLSGRPGDMPKLTEVGGNAMRAYATDKKKKMRSVKYRQHPTMKPAFDKNLTKLPAMLKGSIK